MQCEQAPTLNRFARGEGCCLVWLKLFLNQFLPTLTTTWHGKFIIFFVTIVAIIILYLLSNPQANLVSLIVIFFKQIYIIL